jgi:hypothetical protein
MQAVEAPNREAFARAVADEVRRDFAARYGSDLPDAIAAAAGA